MNMARTVVALSFDSDRLSAISASISDRVKVKGWHTAALPKEIDSRDATAVGRWIGAEFDRAGLPKGKVVIAVPRGDVVLKRLRLPRGEPGELSGMVHLQMAKQLTMTTEGTAIDYIPLAGADRDAAGPSESISILAAALPGDRTAWYRALAKAAGCKIERLGLRASGTATLLADLSQRHTGPVLGVAVGWGSVEFVVVDHGELVFVRAADVGLANSGGEGDAGFVQKVGVEVKRTWMSYRVGDGSSEVDAVIVAGQGGLASDVAQRCGEALEMPWKLAPLPPVVDVSGPMPDAEALVAAPLIGLLSEAAVGSPMLDFVHPRKPPDLGALRRRRVLAAALGLIVAVGAGYVFASGELSSLKRELRLAKGRGTELQTQYADFLTEEARLQHLTHWSAAGVDWLAHAAWINEAMPEPGQVLLDELSGKMFLVEIKVIPKNGAYDASGWQHRQGARLTIDGKVKQRDVANRFRDRLIDSGIYQVKINGADVSDRFDLDLSTDRPRPEPEAPKGRVATQPKAKAGAAEGPSGESGVAISIGQEDGQ